MLCVKLSDMNRIPNAVLKDQVSNSLGPRTLIMSISVLLVAAGYSYYSESPTTLGLMGRVIGLSQQTLLSPKTPLLKLI